MLEGINAVNWASLTHSYGEATDVPGLLQSLLSDDAEVRMQAISDLHEKIWHQGTVFPATAAAVPFLYELLADPDVQDKQGIVSLLGCIATGEGAWERCVRNDGEETCRQMLATRGISLEQKLADDATAMNSIYSAVSSGLRQLLPYLQDPEIGVLVAEALGQFPEHASWLLPAIDAELTSACDEQMREMLSRSRARLSGG